MEWQQILKTNFRNLSSLVDFLELTSLQRSKILNTSPFPLNLPKRLALKIRKGTLEDPILKQFVPLSYEEVPYPGSSLEPTKDSLFRPSEQLLHKYHGRALLISTQACAMHCRYCFRRNFSYKQTDKTFSKELEYLKNHQEVHEVILSGGDPLSLSTPRLQELLKELAQISHVKLLRWHSRFPIGIPERIDTNFLDMLKAFPRQHLFVIHCNHPRELDETIFSSLKKLQLLGIPVMNQAVLLKGVNDSVSILKQLCLDLASHGVLSYYLHYLDRVEGAGHFVLSKEKAKELHQGLTKELPGYALPRLVEEQPGHYSKTPIA